MGRKVAMLWHASFTIGAGVLYFYFVLPRWPELVGDTNPGWGMTLRIVTGALIGLAALPVVFTLLRTQKPELGTPQLALTIRKSSIVAHVLAGVLIIGTAVSENWFSLDKAGQWLFAIYGAAAAIAVLGFFAFYLSFVAELPPPPPKPIKPKKVKERRIRGKKRGKGVSEDSDDAEDTDDSEDEDEAADESEEDSGEAETADETTEAETTETEVAEVDDSTDTKDSDATETVEVSGAESATTESAATEDADDEAGAETVEAAAPAGLRNRRPTGKTSHRRRRTRGGVTVDE